LHQDVVAFCEHTHDLIALLDVPPGLSQGQAERWRSRIDSSWAAAYHPWLHPARRQDDDDDDVLARVLPPSAVAAGIVARKELQRGIQYGPANEVADSIVDLAEAVPADRADAYHPQGMNCFVRETDGIHLVSARTLSRDPQWRQLSVRRLILMLCRTLRRETQWAVFEPNGQGLWDDLTHAIEGLLRQLFRAGALAGATEAESFFVRVRNERPLLDLGELVIEIGVAPAEPLEFILLRLRRADDGTLTLEE
jgi:phage tail sheath protein FI